MTIHEPATMATDYLLTVLGLYLAWRLKSKHPSGNDAVTWWIRSLFCMGISAFVGGSYHGFAANFPTAIDDLWWRIVLWLICLLGFCMGMSLSREISPPHQRRVWDRLLIAKLILSSLAVLIFPDFLIAIIDYGLAMLAWAFVALWRRPLWGGWMFAAVLLSAIAAWVQQSKLGLSEHFNHNDLFHLIQALALIGFYRGGLLLGRNAS